jgi:hypothetical protein
MDPVTARRRPFRVRLLALTGALVAGIALLPAGAQGAPPEPAPIQLKVQEFNIEYGGFHVSWDSTLEVLR